MLLQTLLNIRGLLKRVGGAHIRKKGSDKGRGKWGQNEQNAYIKLSKIL